MTLVCDTKLYQHQKDAIGFIFARGGSGALFMDCGTGKTLVAIKVFEEMRRTEPQLKLIAIMPLSILEAAWGSDIKQFTQLTYYNAHDKPLPKILKEDILLINYESIILKRNIGIINLMRGNMVVLDECFDGNTLIDTPYGQRKIKDIKAGDYITNCFGKCKVTGSRIKKLDRWIKITYNKATIICSFNHPFFTINGWKLAKNIEKGDCLVKTKYAMSMVQKGFCGRTPGEKILRNILFGEMENDTTRNQRESLLLRKSKKKSFCGDKEIYGFSFYGRKIKKRKEEQQITSACGEKKNIRKIKIDKMETNFAGRERETFTNSSKQIIKTSGKVLGFGISSITGEKERRLPYELQDRHSPSWSKNRNRSGRILSLHTKKIRYKKRQNVNFFRVEDVEIYQQRNNGKPRGSSKENLFYDLQIEKHPSFSVNGVLVHNSSRCKNHSAKTTKLLLTLRNLPKYKIIMTATPAPNTPLEYYSQMEWIKPGILHKSFYGFRNNYFHLQRGRQIMSGKLVTRQAIFDAMRTGFKYEILPQNLNKLMDKIEPYIFYARKKDCLDLPEQVDEVRKVFLTPKQMKHYLEMKRHLITEIKQQMIVSQNALTKIMKLRELASGFCINGKDTVEIGESAKMQELKNLIEETGNQPIIIWACFHYEIEQIVKALGNCSTFYSLTKDKEQSLADFREGKTRFMVAHPASMGHGITLTNCSLQIFFSLDYSAERYHQAKNRIHRIGQINKCTYIHLIAAETIEEEILQCLKNKTDMMNIVERIICNG